MTNGAKKIKKNVKRKAKTAYVVAKVLKEIFYHPWITLGELHQHISKEVKISKDQLRRIMQTLEAEGIAISVQSLIKNEGILNRMRYLGFVYVPKKNIGRGRVKKYLMLLPFVPKTLWIESNDSTTNLKARFPTPEEVILYWLFSIPKNPKLNEFKLKQFGDVDEISEEVRWIILKAHITGSIYKKELDIIRKFFHINRLQEFWRAAEEVCFHYGITILEDVGKVRKNDPEWPMLVAKITELTYRILRAYNRIYGEKLKNRSFINSYFNALAEESNPLNRLYDRVGAEIEKYVEYSVNGKRRKIKKYVKRKKYYIQS